MPDFNLYLSIILSIMGEGWGGEGEWQEGGGGLVTSHRINNHKSDFPDASITIIEDGTENTKITSHRQFFC